MSFVWMNLRKNEWKREKEICIKTRNSWIIDFDYNAKDNTNRNEMNKRVENIMRTIESNESVLHVLKFAAQYFVCCIYRRWVCLMPRQI